MNTSLTILRGLVALRPAFRGSHHRALGRVSFSSLNSRLARSGTVSLRRTKSVFVVAAMSGDAAAPPKFTNALAKEESPYLLQHAHNPVDWLPWGPEAFQKAKDEDKPIFLSVGYSTCHWCHVMEHESFEDESTAELLNENFISVKVDREERPDVDKVYMTYIQAISGRGGWPMTVFLTPDLKPIYGGTYFPGKESYGMPSFKKVLNSVGEAWSKQRDLVLEQGEEIMAELAQAVVPDKAEKDEDAGLARSAMDGCTEALGGKFDSALGGFGGAPKFPRPCEINVLLRQYLRKKVENPEEAKGILHMVEYTLERMANGGMYDHLGGGFHRYSVDEHWHVPHFEKMLYDNPQIALTYLNAFQITGEKQWAAVVRGILDYLRRDMTHPEGGIYSAEDADSVDRVTGKKGEGRFYIWTAKEIDEALQGLEVMAFKEHYYVKADGNCDLSERSDPHKEFVGENCLIAMQSIKETASDMNVSVEEAANFLGECRKLLHEKRGQRQRPGLDDKIVSAWNGMSISAFALASRVLAKKEPSTGPCFPVDGVAPGTYLEAARKVARFVQSKLWDSSKGLLRRSFCREPSLVEGFADDYAHVIAGMLDLYETTGELEWLQFGLKLQAKMDELFWDEDAGGYFSTNGSDPSILLRMKEDYDGAEPTASSVALQNLLRLAGLFSDDAYHRKAIKTLTAFSGRLRPLPIALPHMAASSYLLDRWPIRQVVVTGASSMPETQALLDAVHGTFTPDKVVVVIDTSDEESVSFWREKNPAAAAVAGASLEDPGAAATVFVCQNFSCQAPTSDPEKVEELLSKGKVEQKPQAVDIDFLMKKPTE